MAKKRQRKKQQAKKNIELLQKVGIQDKKIIKQLKNNPKQVTAVYKKENRNRIARERTDYMVHTLGLKMDKENRSKRYWSQSRWDEWVKLQEKKRRDQEKRKKRKEKKDNDLHLVIFWRDKTAEGFAFEDAVTSTKRAYRYMDNEYLIAESLKILRSSRPVGLAIGQATTSLVKGNNMDAYIKFMEHTSYYSSQMSESNDWTLVYKGRAVRYHEILLSIYTVLSLLYDPYERAEFFGTLMDRDIPQINPKMAERLATDFKYNRF